MKPHMAILAFVMILDTWLTGLHFLASRLEETAGQPTWVNVCRVISAIGVAVVTSWLIWRGAKA